MTPGTLLWTPAYRPPENLPQTGSRSLFTITGLVRIWYLVARVTTVLGASASTLKFVFDPATAAANTDLCAAAAQSGLAAGNWFYPNQSFNPGIALLASDNGGAAISLASAQAPGASALPLPAGEILLTASGAQTGQAEFYVGWQAVDKGSALVVT